MDDYTKEPVGKITKVILVVLRRYHMPLQSEEGHGKVPNCGAMRFRHRIGVAAAG